MQRKLASLIAVPAALALTFSLAACGGDDKKTDSSSDTKKEATSKSEGKKEESAKKGGGKASGTLNGAGASSQKAAMSAWQAGFTEANPKAKVNYDPVGSGSGRKKFIGKATAFAGSDAYLAKEQLADAKKRCGGEIIELPLYISPIAVAYNVEGVDKLNLSPDTLAKIFDQKITKWNDAAIKKDNPDAELPDLKITPVNRSDESGTTENFVEYLSIAAKGSWKHEVSGDWPVSGGESAKGTSGVVKTIESGKGTIGYADASQINKLSKANIKVGDDYVELTSKAAAKVVDASTKVDGRGDYDFAIDVKRDTKESGAYPIVLVSYTIACTKYEDKETAELAKSWITYIASEEAQVAASKLAGSAPISDTTRKNAMKAVEAISAS